MKKLYTVLLNGNPSTFPISELNETELANFKNYISSIYKPEDHANVVEVTIQQPNSMVLMDKSYDCDMLCDVERDVYESLEESSDIIAVDNNGFSDGQYTVRITYSE